MSSTQQDWMNVCWAGLENKEKIGVGIAIIFKPRLISQKD
jgi:hypothetical protein